VKADEYGTSMHYPHCINASCTGCLPPLPPFIADRHDPVVKHDAAGQPVRASDPSLGNRAARRRLARDAQRQSRHEAVR